MKTKECRRCYTRKPLAEFCKSSRLSDGLQTWCKPCVAQRKRELRSPKRTPEQREGLARILENRGLLRFGLKRCTTCKEIKLLSEFPSGRRNGYSGKRGRCSECQSSWLREHRKSRPSPSSPPSIRKKAIKAVYDAITRGDMTRPTECPICSNSPHVFKHGVREFSFTTQTVILKIVGLLVHLCVPVATEEFT